MCVCVEAKKSVRRYLFFLRVLRARVVLQCVCDSGGDREMKGKKNGSSTTGFYFGMYI